jgi:uncharacterized membrane protein YidH (DUF202 family)
MLKQFSQSLPLLWLGILGLLLAAVCSGIAVVHGTLIPPEGDLTKVMTFDAAVGIFLITIALFVPLAGFTERGLRRWLRTLVTLTSYGFAVETIQILRGIDPRFSRVGGTADQIIGTLFGIAALGIMVLFLILMVKLWRRPLSGPDQLILLSIRYASVITMIGFFSGFWMGALQGRHVSPGGNILPLHALSFHAVQSVPLVALLLRRSNLSIMTSKLWIHAAGLTWLGVCLAVGRQTAAGLPVTEASGTMLLAYGLAVLWAICLAKAALASLATRQTANA